MSTPFKGNTMIGGRVGLLVQGKTDYDISDNVMAGNGINAVLSEGPYDAGLAPEVPIELVRELFQKLIEHPEWTEQQVVEEAKTTGLERWISAGGNLASIASYLMQAAAQFRV